MFAVPGRGHAISAFLIDNLKSQLRVNRHCDGVGRCPGGGRVNECMLRSGCVNCWVMGKRESLWRARSMRTRPVVTGLSRVDNWAISPACLGSVCVCVCAGGRVCCMDIGFGGSECEYWSMYAGGNTSV